MVVTRKFIVYLYIFFLFAQVADKQQMIRAIPCLVFKIHSTLERFLCSRKCNMIFILFFMCVSNEWNDLKNTGTDLLEDAMREKKNMNREFQRQIQLMNRDHKKEIEVRNQPFSPTAAG